MAARIPLPYPFDDRDQTRLVDLDMMEHLRFRNARKTHQQNLHIPHPERIRLFPGSYRESYSHVSFPTYGHSVTVKVSYNGNPATASAAGKARIKANTRDAICYQIGESRDKCAFSSDEDDISQEMAVETFKDDAVFKLMISPDDPSVLTKEYVRDIMENLEKKSGYSLKWIAAVHDNTAHPHVHIIISRTSGDKRLSWDSPLKLDRTLISEGIRKYAQEQATRILGRKSLEEWKRPFNETVENIGPARIDYVINGGRKDMPLFVPTSDGSAILRQDRLNKLPIWQQILIERRLQFLSEHSSAGFKKVNGKWICTEPHDWMRIVADEGKLARFSDIARTQGNGKITILRHNRPLGESIDGNVIASTVVDENSERVGLVVKSDKDGQLYYVETSMSYGDYKSINGRNVHIRPRKANVERYRIPEVHIEKTQVPGGPRKVR